MRFLFILLLFLITTRSISQNLVPNGDFEQVTSCPTYATANPPTIYQQPLDSVLFWFNPASYGNADYFHSCAPINSGVNVPYPFMAFQNAHSGNAYVGLIPYVEVIQNGREYIATTLTSPLVANTCYYFEMYVNDRDSTKFSVSNLGVYFSDSIISSLSYDTMPMNFVPQISNQSGNFFSEVNWNLISGTYIASGGENFIIIGNFKNDSLTNFIIKDSSQVNGRAYVFIDDVLLTPCTSIGETESKTSINISPNPFTDNLNISINNSSSFVFTLYDIIGKEISHQKIIGSESIDTQKIAPGTYFYIIKDNWELISSGKIIKH